MEFLKALFGTEPLTYDQLTEKLQTAGKDGKAAKLADLSQGQYVAISKYQAVETERDEARNQLADVGEKLKAFDGVDVDGLKGQITALQTDMDTKDKAWQQKLADRDFSDLLSAEITTAKGINSKAIVALLDVDTLKASKNQKEDISAAVKALSESDAYLFKADTPPPPNYAAGTGSMKMLGGKKELSVMGYRERLELKKQNPAMYEQMTKQEE